MLPRNCLLTIGFFCFACNMPAQVAVSVDGMNVLYPGIENPMTVAATDIPDSNLLLIPSMGTIHRTGLGHYAWTICHRDTNFATLTIRDLQGDSVASIFTFRINRIPEPTAVLGSKLKSKVMVNGEACSVGSGGIALILKNFDFDIKCYIVRFDLHYIPKGQDGLIKRNSGARWNSEVQDQISKAKPGDEYYFYNIAYRCGCDPMIRYITEDLFFVIK
jgi:hypothetical protein